MRRKSSRTGKSNRINIALRPSNNKLLRSVESVKQYATRWLIEEFHKALKTGLGAKKLQLEEANRLFAAISIMSIIALRLIDIRERVRITEDKPAKHAGLSALKLNS